MSGINVTEQFPGQIIFSHFLASWKTGLYLKCETCNFQQAGFQLLQILFPPKKYQTTSILGTYCGNFSSCEQQCQLYKVGGPGTYVPYPKAWDYVTFLSFNNDCIT